MAKRGSPWQSGRRAWERLNGWHQDGRSATPGHPDDGDAALEALGDVGHVRNLLSQAELVAVRTARRHGKSWTEIATRLGVTRQSAWERWRDLDESVAQDPPVPDAVDEIVERAARDLRRRSTVTVPKVVGMPVVEAQRALQTAALFAVGADPDGPPLGTVTWPDAVVADQVPEAGAKVPTGSTVTLWIGRGGGFGGVREPRRPKPGPRTLRAAVDEPSEDAVG